MSKESLPDVRDVLTILVPSPFPAPVVDTGVVVTLNAHNAASSAFMVITSGVSSFEVPTRRIDLPVKITTSVVY
jgi:hypothetical protein